MKIALFTGHTGGHFFPAVAFAQCLKARHPQSRLLFVTSERGRSLANETRGELEAEFEFLDPFPWPRPNRPEFILRFFPFLGSLRKAVSETGKMIDRFRPDLCVGFGSYVAFPGIVESKIRKIPTLIHEQNCLLGKSNAFLIRWADHVALSFDVPENLKLRIPSRVTGLPLRSTLIRAAEERASRKRTPFPVHLIILGGSQGAKSLNRLWGETFSSFSREEKSQIAVSHITGEMDYEEIKQMYLSQKFPASVFPYYKKMDEVFAGADLALTRGGAGMLFELALFGIPSLIFPYPHADGHQEKNARYFEQRGAALRFTDGRCTPAELKTAVMCLVQKPGLRETMSEKLKNAAIPDAGERLVDLAEAIMAQKGDLIP